MLSLVWVQPLSLARPSRTLRTFSLLIGEVDCCLRARKSFEHFWFFVLLGGGEGGVQGARRGGGLVVFFFFFCENPRNPPRRGGGRGLREIRGEGRLNTCFRGRNSREVKSVKICAPKKRPMFLLSFVSSLFCLVSAFLSCKNPNVTRKHGPFERAMSFCERASRL